MSLLSVNRNSPMRGRYVTELSYAAGVMIEQFFDVAWWQIMKDDRTVEISRARRWATWWMHQQGCSLREIGRCIRRDHKAVQRMVSVARWEDEHDRMNSEALKKIADGALAKARLAEISRDPLLSDGEIGHA